MTNRYDVAMRLANEYLGEDNTQAILGLKTKLEALRKTKQGATDDFKKKIAVIDKQIQQVQSQLTKLGDIDLGEDE